MSLQLTKLHSENVHHVTPKLEILSERNAITPSLNKVKDDLGAISKRSKSLRTSIRSKKYVAKKPKRSGSMTSRTSVHSARIVNGQLVVDYPYEGRPYQYFYHEFSKAGLQVFPEKIDQTVTSVAQHENCKLSFGKGWRRQGSMLGKQNRMSKEINYDNKIPGPGAYAVKDRLVRNRASSTKIMLSQSDQKFHKQIQSMINDKKTKQFLQKKKSNKNNKMTEIKLKIKNPKVKKVTKKECQKCIFESIANSTMSTRRGTCRKSMVYTDRSSTLNRSLMVSQQLLRPSLKSIKVPRQSKQTSMKANDSMFSSSTTYCQKEIDRIQKQPSFGLRNSVKYSSKYEPTKKPKTKKKTVKKTKKTVRECQN